MSRSGVEVEDTKTKKLSPSPFSLSTPGEEKLGQWEDLHLIHQNRYLVPLDELLAVLERLRHFDRLQRDIVCGAAAAALTCAAAAASSSSGRRHVPGTSLLTRTKRHRRRVSVRPWPFLPSLLSFRFVIVRAVGIEFTAADSTATSSCCSVRGTIPTEPGT